MRKARAKAGSKSKKNTARTSGGPLGVARGRETLTAGSERGRVRGMFDQAKAETVCARLSQEPVSLQSVLRQEGIPSSSWYKWLDASPELRENYARAREMQADADADMIADVRQQVIAGDITPEQGRVAIDSLKWEAGKRKPKVYGDKIQVDQDLTMRVEVVDPTAIARVIASPALPSPAAAARLVASDDSDV